jgi:hypothetical protein
MPELKIVLNALIKRMSGLVSNCSAQMGGVFCFHALPFC